MASPDYILGGPIYWLMVVLMVLAGMLSAFVIVHALLISSRGRLAGLQGSVWLYAAPQAIYLALLFFVQTPLLPLVASAVLVLITPLALIQQLTYLLRVVFPRPVAPDVAVEADEDTDAHDDEASSELPAALGCRGAS